MPICKSFLREFPTSVLYKLEASFPEQAYEQVKCLWKQLKQSKKDEISADRRS